MAADDKNVNTPAGNGILDMEALKRRALEIDAMPEGEEKERQKFLLSQDYEGLKEIYGADLVSSESMFNERMPEGRNAGGVYVAANPLEFLSSALRQGIGASGRRNTMDKLKQLSADKAEGLGNTMFGQGGQVAQAQGNHNMPVAGMAAAEAAANQTQAQKPDYSQYGYGDPVVRAGMAQLQGRDIPQHVQNSADRRSQAAAAGVDLPPPGTGPIGQTKKAAGITPRSEALRAMGGNHNAPVAGLAMANSANRGASGGWDNGGGASGSWGVPEYSEQQQRPVFAGNDLKPYNPRGAAISQGLTGRMNPAFDPEEQKRKEMFALLDSMTRR